MAKILAYNPTIMNGEKVMSELYERKKKKYILAYNPNKKNHKGASEKF